MREAEGEIVDDLGLLPGEELAVVAVRREEGLVWGHRIHGSHGTHRATTIIADANGMVESELIRSGSVRAPGASGRGRSFA